MKVWEEILLRLRNGEPPEVVRKDYRSESQFAKALRIHVDELSKEAGQVRETRLQEEERLGQLKADSQQAQAENKEVKGNVEMLRAESEQLTPKVEKLRKGRRALLEDVKLLRQRGYSEEVVSRLKSSGLSGAELDEVLKNRSKRLQLEKEVATLEKKRADLTAEVAILPEKVQFLAAIEEKIARKKQECAELDEIYEDKKMKMQILEENFVRAINRVGNTSIETLRQANAEGRDKIVAACERVDGQIQAMMAALATTLNTKLNWLEVQKRKENELAQQRILFEADLRWGRFFRALFESDDFLAKVSLPWILHVSQRIQLWLSINLPEATVIPPRWLQSQMGIMHWPYRLSAVSELLRLGLEDASRQTAQPQTAKDVGGFVDKTHDKEGCT